MKTSSCLLVVVKFATNNTGNAAPMSGLSPILAVNAVMLKLTFEGLVTFKQEYHIQSGVC